MKRFWAKVDKSGDCWEWTTGKAFGYGRIKLGGRTLRAHRVAYELVVGPIPDGLALDHLCRNRSCVNPDHLEPVTDRVNILRGEGPTAVNAQKTHCLQGHPFDAANTYHYSYGKRECLTCRRERDRRRRQTQKKVPRVRSMRVPKAECPQGHPYDEANTYISRAGKRYCRACNREVARRRRERKKAS